MVTTAAVVWLFIRAMRYEPQRWTPWIAAGVLTGVVMEIKILAAPLLACCLLGVVICGPRSRLRSPRPWAAVAIALLMAAPNLVAARFPDGAWLCDQLRAHATPRVRAAAHGGQVLVRLGDRAGARARRDRATSGRPRRRSFTHYGPRLRDNERRVLHGAPLRGGPALHYNGNLVSAQALPR
jgi:4-amino-4-deoxy-L-arabinose transferase-like glycosyltransferase